MPAWVMCLVAYDVVYIVYVGMCKCTYVCVSSGDGRLCDILAAPPSSCVLCAPSGEVSPSMVHLVVGGLSHGIVWTHVYTAAETADLAAMY